MFKQLHTKERFRNAGLNSVCFLSATVQQSFIGTQRWKAYVEGWVEGRRRWQVSTYLWPFRAAWCRGVYPVLSTQFTLGPLQMLWRKKKGRNHKPDLETASCWGKNSVWCSGPSTWLLTKADSSSPQRPSAPFSSVTIEPAPPGAGPLKTPRILRTAHWKVIRNTNEPHHLASRRPEHPLLGECLRASERPI